MPSQIIAERNGSTSAFTNDNRLVMSMGRPLISTYLSVKEIQEWMTTLEEIMDVPSMACHRYHLQTIYFTCKGALKRHNEEHAEVVSEAPTAEDLQEYLASYAVAISNNGH